MPKRFTNYEIDSDDEKVDDEEYVDHEDDDNWICFIMDLEKEFKEYVNFYGVPLLQYFDEDEW